jgi:hypothetical protein
MREAWKEMVPFVKESGEKDCRDLSVWENSLQEIQFGEQRTTTDRLPEMDYRTGERLGFVVPRISLKLT